MKTLIRCITILLILTSLNTHARVIGSDYIDDVVGVYYFNTETEGFILDQGSNEVNGVFIEDAALTEEGKYGKCLSLAAKDDYFGAFNDEAFIGSLNKFSIVAWAKIPKQADDFEVTAYSSDPGFPDSVVTGAARLTVKSDGNLSALYADLEDNKLLTVETTDQNVSDNRWHHIAFTISRTQMRLYLDGERITEKTITGYTSFLGDETLISIGHDAIGSIDNAGFFDDTFNDVNIKLIYDVGLQKIMSIASVDPQAKVTTTWGAIKSQ